MKRFLLEIVGVAALAGGLAVSQVRSAAASDGQRVDLWLVDPAGAVDGVRLGNGQAVYFAPEVARTAALSIRMDDPLRLEAATGRRWLVDERDHSRIELVASPARGGGPRAALGRLTAQGPVDSWLRGPDGRLDGFVLGTGEQVRVPTSLMDRVIRGVRIGEFVTVRGLGTHGSMGTGLEALSIANDQGETLLQR